MPAAAVQEARRQRDRAHAPVPPDARTYAPVARHNDLTETQVQAAVEGTRREQRDAFHNLQQRYGTLAVMALGAAALAGVGHVSTEQTSPLFFTAAFFPPFLAAIVLLITDVVDIPDECARLRRQAAALSRVLAAGHPPEVIDELFAHADGSDRMLFDMCGRLS